MSALPKKTDFISRFEFSFLCFLAFSVPFSNHTLRDFKEEISNNVRKRIQKAFVKYKHIYFKHSKKLLFADYDTLSDENKQALMIMLSQSEDLYTAWRLKENFKYFRRATTKQDAEQELLSWILEAEESELSEFKAATTAFHNWGRSIVNSVIYKYSNGITEGFNNKIKVLKRNAYRYRNFDNFRKRIMLNCSKNGNQACS